MGFRPRPVPALFLVCAWLCLCVLRSMWFAFFCFPERAGPGLLLACVVVPFRACPAVCYLFIYCYSVFVVSSPFPCWVSPAFVSPPPPVLACPLVGPPFVLLCCLAFGRLPPPPTPSPRSFASWFPHHPDTEGARFLPGFLCLPFLTAASAASRASPLTAGAAAIVVVSYV